MVAAALKERMQWIWGEEIGATYEKKATMGSKADLIVIKSNSGHFHAIFRIRW